MIRTCLNQGMLYQNMYDSSAVNGRGFVGSGRTDIRIQKNTWHFSRNFDKRPRKCSDRNLIRTFPGTFVKILRKMTLKKHVTFRGILTNVPGEIRIGIRCERFLGRLSKFFEKWHNRKTCHLCRLTFYAG